MGLRGHGFVFGVGQKRDIARSGFIQALEPDKPFNLGAVSFGTDKLGDPTRGERSG